MTTSGELAADDGEMTMTTIRIGLDLVRASAGLRHEVMRRIAAAGLRPTRVVITVGRESRLGAREIVYPVIDVVPDFDLSDLVPFDHVGLDWTHEERDASNLHVLATGITSWLTVRDFLREVDTPPQPPPLPEAGGT